MTSLDETMTLAHGSPWRNRVALAPMTNRQSRDDGVLSDDERAWLVRRAEGGFGLVMTCAAHVTANGQGWPGAMGISEDAHLEGLARLADELRAAGAVSSVQLHHGGRRADPVVVPERVAPWDDERHGARALLTGEIEALVEDFARAAARAEAAGLDGAEVHGAHGYLIGQFLDRDRNQRSDGYGGDRAGRSRFLREILEAIRSSTGPDFQLGLRLSPERNGIHLDDATSLAQEMMMSGLIDYLDVSLWDVFKHPEESPRGERSLLSHFTGLERGTTRLGVAGKIQSAAHMRAILEGGVDFVSVGTAAILHHDFASLALADDAFVAVTPPVSADHLAAEAVSPAFLEYLREIRPELIDSAG